MKKKNKKKRQRLSDDEIKLRAYNRFLSGIYYEPDGTVKSEYSNVKIT